MPQDTEHVAARLSDLLGPGPMAVAGAFRPAAPGGVPRVERAAPAEVAPRLETIVHANRELERYHEGRRRTPGSAAA
jgi:hypothetical protein